MPRRLLPLILALVCMSACTIANDESARRVLDSIAANHVGELTWAIAWRSMLGGVLGLGVGVGAFFGVRHAKGFRWNWEHAKWVRALTGVTYALTFASALAWFGFWQGTQAGTEQVVTKGQIGTEVLPYVGEAGSAMLAVVYVGGELICEQGQALDETQQAALDAKLASYVAGEWEMELEVLHARLTNVRNCVLSLSTEQAIQQIYARYPELEGTVADDIMPWALDQLADQLAAQLTKTLAENEQVGIYAKPLIDTLSNLDQAAARRGEPAMLSHRELSEHIVEVGVIPMVMLPVEHIAAGQRKAGLLAALALLLISIGLFQLAHYLYERRRAQADAATPPPESRSF